MRRPSVLLAATQQTALPHLRQHLHISRQQHKLTALMRLSMRCRPAALQQQWQRSSTCSTAAGGGVLWRACTALTGSEREHCRPSACPAGLCLFVWVECALMAAVSRLNPGSLAYRASDEGWRCLHMVLWTEQWPAGEQSVPFECCSRPTMKQCLEHVCCFKHICNVYCVSCIC